MSKDTPDNDTAQVAAALTTISAHQWDTVAEAVKRGDCLVVDHYGRSVDFIAKATYDTYQYGLMSKGDYEGWSGLCDDKQKFRVVTLRAATDALEAARQREAVLAAALKQIRQKSLTIIENEHNGYDACRYCGVVEVGLDDNGQEVNRSDEDAVITEFHINHEKWCPSVIIGEIFGGRKAAALAKGGA